MSIFYEIEFAKYILPYQWQRRAARYALRVSRSAVVSLSLLRQSRI